VIPPSYIDRGLLISSKSLSKSTLSSLRKIEETHLFVLTDPSILTKRNKKIQIIAYSCILLFKENIKWGKFGVAVCIVYKNLLTGSN
jgi:hypothetical protein